MATWLAAALGAAWWLSPPDALPATPPGARQHPAERPRAGMARTPAVLAVAPVRRVDLEMRRRALASLAALDTGTAAAAHLALARHLAAMGNTEDAIRSHEAAVASTATPDPRAVGEWAVLDMHVPVRR